MTEATTTEVSTGSAVSIEANKKSLNDGIRNCKQKLSKIPAKRPNEDRRIREDRVYWDDKLAEFRAAQKEAEDFMWPHGMMVQLPKVQRRRMDLDLAAPVKPPPTPRRSIREGKKTISASFTPGQGDNDKMLGAWEAFRQRRQDAGESTRNQHMLEHMLREFLTAQGLF